MKQIEYNLLEERWVRVRGQDYTVQEVSLSDALLHAHGDTNPDRQVIENLTIARIDYCTFGNSKPFRVRIINRLNDNYDHFYIKKADASRIYGLELEYILSPNRIAYLSNGDTLIEEHIPGLPGDIFITHRLNTSKFNQIRICKEFVKFTERCFVRLLGDMRSYNFVVDITPDIEGNQYRIRAIDFDQQSYEGRRKFYLPNFFKENNPFVNLGIKYINEATMRQYQEEERGLIAHRVRMARFRLHDLMKVMRIDHISPPEKVRNLAIELGDYHQTPTFEHCKTMGQILTEHMRIILTRQKY